MTTNSSHIYASLQPLLEQARTGATVVTANQRAARFLRQQYAADMQEHALNGWASPIILPWEAWLESLWQQLLLNSDEDRLLLNAAQEFQVWESIVQIPAGEGSLSALSIAEMARNAWRLVGNYAVDRANWRTTARGRKDWQAMHQWATAFEKRCEIKRWQSHATLAQEITRAAEAGKLQTPEMLCLVGFDTMTTAQERLIAALEPRTRVHRIMPTTQPVGAGLRTEAVSADEEMEIAALWADQQLDQGARRLAIISPASNGSRGDLERTLSRMLGQDAFRFSLGMPLAQHTLAKTALLLLEWSLRPLSLDEVSWLLLSPNFGGDAGPDEISARAMFDAHVLRRMDFTQPQLSLSQFTWRLEKKFSSAPEEWSLLAGTLRCGQQGLEFIEKGGLRSRQQSAFEWADSFQRALSLFGFPGKRGQDSYEFQTYERWQALLDQFAGLAFDGSRWTASRALQSLRRLAETSIFQPDIGERPVQVMGALEAAGSLFDGIWFLSAREMTWPGIGRPHPLLPWQIQRDAEMLHSSPAIDYEWGANITRRLVQSAPGAIFSWARQYGAESAQPSPLIHTFESVDLSKKHRLHLVPDKREIESECFPDTLPITWEKSRGTLPSEALRAQAACPFKAFATIRMQARPLEAPDDGLDPRQRGKFVHQLMQSIWTSAEEPLGLQNLKNLQQHIKNDTLHAFVMRHAEAKIKTHRSADRWEQQFYAAERERLIWLVEDWLLTVEARRPNFEVRETEKAYQGLEIGDAAFNVKVDRIDRLLKADGFDDDGPDELILLDYKTGIASVKLWQGDRPDEPQLPLYATYALAENALAAVAFAHMTSEKPRFRGVALRAGVLPLIGGKELSLESDLPLWRKTVLDLTNEFVAGNSRVDPKDGPNTCRVCGCSSLCRITEVRRAVPSDVAAETEDELD